MQRKPVSILLPGVNRLAGENVAIFRLCGDMTCEAVDTVKLETGVKDTVGNLLL
jgi:hypothetical protein